MFNGNTFGALKFLLQTEAVLYDYFTSEHGNSCQQLKQYSVKESGIEILVSQVVFKLWIKIFNVFLINNRKNHPVYLNIYNTIFEFL